MNMVIPNEGKKEWLRRMLIKQAVGNIGGALFVRLYKNDLVPIDASVWSSFTWATFTGSGPFGIGPNYWTDPVIVADVGQTDQIIGGNPPMWTNTGSTTETAYGWVLYDGDSSIAMAAQRFDVPRVMAPGSIEKLDPFRLKFKTFL